MADVSIPSGFSEGFVPVVGGKLHYVSAGEGEQTIVLLHKLGGWASEWRWVMQILATRMRTIAVDLTGHGESTMSGDPPFIATQEEMAAQLMATLDELGVENSVLCGSSMGGCVAALCAAQWPERVSGLITVGSALAGAADRSGLKAAADKAIADGFFDAQENPMPRDPSYMEQIFAMRDPAHMQEMTLSRRAAGRWIQPCARGVGIFDYLAILPKIEAPTLLTSGANGNYGGFIDEASALLKNGRAGTIEDASAFPHQDRPEETATAIMDFLGV